MGDAMASTTHMASGKMTSNGMVEWPSVACADLTQDDPAHERRKRAFESFT